MAAGTIQFVINSVNLTIDPIAQIITVGGSASKYITDDLGGQIVIATYQGTVTYPVAGAGTKTLAQIKSDLLTAMQAQNPALQGKTVS